MQSTPAGLTTIARPLARILVLLPLSALAVSSAAELREVNPPDEPDPGSLIAIDGARLIDGRGETPIEDAIVVVHGSKIVSAGTRASVIIPEGASRVDARGMSLLPGFFDSHFHSVNNLETPVEFLLKRGITSLRDPGHPFRFYQAVMQSSGPMPRAFLTGAHLDAYPPVWPQQAALVKDANDARRIVNEHVDRGASAIKIYFRLPLEHIAAACEAATARGVPVTAHLELVDADDAIRTGVVGIEHATSFGTALADSPDAERFKNAVAANSNARREFRYRLWANLDLDTSPRVQPVLDVIVNHNVFVSPTLAVFERRAGRNGATDLHAAAFAKMIRFVGMCHRAGAKLVVGSHTFVPFARGGQAYLREMELLVQAGLTPLEAITAGTLHNAQFFRVAARLGTIEVGKTADLVLVKGNPATDVKALTNVRRVMLNGAWLSRSTKSGSK